jgi:hypothetical protein
METFQPTIFHKPTLRESKLQEGWSEVKRKNPRLLPHLARLALELKHAGHPRYSMDGLFHILRWETRQSTGDLGLKINNNYSAFAARDIMVQYPQLEGFFKTRQQRPRNPYGQLS